MNAQVRSVSSPAPQVSLDRWFENLPQETSRRVDLFVLADDCRLKEGDVTRNTDTGRRGEQSYIKFRRTIIEEIVGLSDPLDMSLYMRSARIPLRYRSQPGQVVWYVKPFRDAAGTLTKAEFHFFYGGVKKVIGSDGLPCLVDDPLGSGHGHHILVVNGRGRVTKLRYTRWPREVDAAALPVIHG